MAQFDVYRLARAGTYPLVLDVQSDLHGRLATRVVVPLVPRAKASELLMTRLVPVVRISGSDYAAMFPLLASIPTKLLGSPVSSLAAQRATLIAALDLLITGN